MSATPYEILLGAHNSLQGYRCKVLSRSSAPDIIPRFGTGQTGQSELDLLKSESVDSIAGGMFQRDHKDRHKVARAYGMFNRADEKFYPVVPPSSNTSIDYQLLSKAESYDYSYFGTSQINAGNVNNKLYQVNSGGTFSTITLPAAIASGTSTAGFMANLHIHKNYLYLSMETPTASANNYRMKISDSSFQDIGGVSTMMFSLRGVLYAVGKPGIIYQVTNEFAAGSATFTEIETIGTGHSGDYNIRHCLEFNGAVWIAARNGIYRFDGTKAVKVLNIKTERLHEYNGALYFGSTWLYRFDGTNLERLHYFGLDEQIQVLGFASSPDYLFFQTLTQTSEYSQDDKVSSASALRRVYTWDNQSFNLLKESSETFLATTNIGGLVMSTGAGLIDILCTSAAGSAWTSTRRQFNLNSIFVDNDVTTSSVIEITTSEDDAGFPNIYKSLEEIQPLYDDMANGDVITISYQLFNGTSWSAWYSLTTIVFGSTFTFREVTTLSQKLYKRLKINVSVSLVAGSTFKLKGLAWRYTLQPRHRFKWDMTLSASGNNKSSDQLGIPISTDSNNLTNLIVGAIKYKTPIYLLPPDYGEVHAQINSGALTLLVKGRFPLHQDLYQEYPLVAVINNSSVWEILIVLSSSYDSVNDRTELVFFSRGYLGITAAQINAGAEIRPCYRVFINSLTRETTILDGRTYNHQESTGESQIEREFVIQATEV